MSELPTTFKYFTDADRLAAKNGYTEKTGRIYLSPDGKKYACIIKIDGIIQAFIGKTGK